MPNILTDLYIKQIWVNEVTKKLFLLSKNLRKHILGIIVLEIGVLTFIDSLLVIKKNTIGNVLILTKCQVFRYQKADA